MSDYFATRPYTPFQGLQRTFTDWLWTQRQREDEVGKFATEAWHDDCLRPSGPRTLVEHLTSAHPEAWNPEQVQRVVDKAASEWRQQASSKRPVA